MSKKRSAKISTVSSNCESNSRGADTTLFFRSDTESKSVIGSSSIGSVLKEWKAGKEAFLFIIPHDDDLVIGLGIFFQRVLAAKIPYRIVIVTDGRNGYTRARDRKNIVKIRKAETYASFSALGVPRDRITCLDFPDANLTNYIGRRRVGAGEVQSSPGVTGLEDAFSKVIRAGIVWGGVKFEPTRIVVPTPTDYHFDHRVVAEQTPISIFHASGAIWPENGPKLKSLPYLYHFAVYCDFDDSPGTEIMIHGSKSDLEAKLRAIRAYESQEQIEAMIQAVRKQKRVEAMKEHKFTLFSRDEFYGRFANRKVKWVG